ncbi:epsilon-sarcoglycan isoform X3 [Dermacentor andersoni]|uniref:epsilon-sarcoglycan isoform X3 n=1 Tax=Dermacentor andersoni TaxID=34620 RepID=UPI002416C974|nr:epsilon-sarcoglycan-like isoform X3 [Dermacentor andersoni]
MSRLSCTVLAFEGLLLGTELIDQLSSAELLPSLRASAIRVSERRGTNYRTMSLLKALVSATFLLSCSCFGAKLQDFRNQVLQTTEVFHFYIDKDMFDASIDSYGRTEFRAALLGKPDLPKWMFLRQTGNSNRALLYGSYQDNGELNIEVFAINKYNYKTSLRVISLQVEKRPREALYEVEMKFLNLNIEDLFEGDWLSDLEEIFRDHLWKESPVIYVTKVASVVDIGGRVPVNPKDKEGIVVRIGGTTNFSQELRTLEVEANQLRNRVSCPRDYKRTSAEYRFRSRSFLPDWCGFRLITFVISSLVQLPEQLDGEGMMQHQDAAFSPIPLEEDSYNPPDMGHLPRRDLLADFLLSLLLPGFVTAMLLSTLTCFMCCQHEEDVPSTQVEQHSSIERATNALRQMATKRNLSSAASSRVHSRAGSPLDASLPRPSRQGTLKLRALPPPPYSAAQNDA